MTTCAIPAPLFTKMYMDTMHLPRSAGLAYIVQGRCSLTYVTTPNSTPSLKKPRELSATGYFKMDVLCRWGTLVETVSDNGKPFVAALGDPDSFNHLAFS